MYVLVDIQLSKLPNYKFISDLQQVRGFLGKLLFHPPIELTEILLKVALNILTQNTAYVLH